MARYGFLFVFLMNNVSFFQLPEKSPTFNHTYIVESNSTNRLDVKKFFI